MAKYCRICTNEVTEGDYKPENACNLPLLLKLYLMELKSEVSDSVVCLRCFSVLQLFHTLRCKALRTETKVQSYATGNPEKKVFTMADILSKKDAKEKQTEKKMDVNMDNSNEIIVTIDSSSDDEDEEMLIEDMIVKEDNDLGALIKSEADDDSDV